ncbi:MAG: hypothetical protein GF355_04995 [Candidatus Eisenbacteria bacterium]|nr:hypothetical protein [Candidatus Eisenbacteria bacterium]
MSLAGPAVHFQLCLVLLAAVCLSCGCAAPIKDLTRTQYINEEFTSQQLQTGGLALLPIVAGAGQEGYRRPLGDHLNRELPNAVVNAKTISWQATMESINANELVEEYEQIVTGYQKTAILNRKLVRNIGASLEVRYALYCSLQDVSERDVIEYSILFGTSSKTVANVLVHCLVFDLQTGDIVQEIVGTAHSEASEFEYTRGYESHAQVLAHGVLSQLPGSSVEPIKLERDSQQSWHWGKRE